MELKWLRYSNDTRVTLIDNIEILCKFFIRRNCKFTTI